jgi:uncharacterized coiled-coil protein SlyX
MKVTEEQRRALFERVRDHLDEDTANLLLEVTVPVNVDLATRSDIQELRAEMLWSFSQLDGRLSGQMTELDRRMTSLDGRLSAQITELDGRLSAQITELDRRMTSLDGRLTAQITGLDGRLTGQITELDGRLTGQITGLDGRMVGLPARVDQVGADLRNLLLHRVIPAIAGIIGIATSVSHVLR